MSLSKSSKFFIQTTYNLPQFNTPSYSTQLLLSNLDLLKNIKIKEALFFNPNHGYLPVAVCKLKNISNITLTDRNLQALKISKTNLTKNGYNTANISLSHQVGLEKRGKTFNCIIGTVDEKENPKVISILANQLTTLISKKGIILVASNSRTISRLEKLIRKTKKLSIIKRKKTKRKMFLAITRNPTPTLL